MYHVSTYGSLLTSFYLSRVGCEDDVAVDADLRRPCEHCTCKYNSRKTACDCSIIMLTSGELVVQYVRRTKQTPLDGRKEDKTTSAEREDQWT